MTEAEWLASKDPQVMLRYRQDQDAVGPLPWFWGSKLSDRKLRLFACACCRAVWPLLTDERSRYAVEVAERYADGDATADELRQGESEGLAGDPRRWLAGAVSLKDAAVAASHLLTLLATHGLGEQPPTVQAALLRDVVGNPFRPVTLPGWRTRETDGTVTHQACPWLTPTASALATAAYQERLEDGALDPARLAVLSDVLEEAGCQDESILEHLRSSGPHVRGCWVLDLLLGKGVTQ